MLKDAGEQGLPEVVSGDSYMHFVIDDDIQCFNYTRKTAVLRMTLLSGLITRQ